MYLPDDKIERGTLRQGDIISNIHLTGAININSINYSTILGKPDEFISWTIANKPTFGDAVILSHSCEIALENKVKVTSIILAPLRDIDAATAKDRIDELIKSNIIDPNNPQPTYLKYFYLSPNDKCQYSNGSVVDFSKLFSVRKQAYDFLISRKIAQLSEMALDGMALKLALYFHRNNKLAA